MLQVLTVELKLHCILKIYTLDIYIYYYIYILQVMIHKSQYFCVPYNDSEVIMTTRYQEHFF